MIRNISRIRRIREITMPRISIKDTIHIEDMIQQEIGPLRAAIKIMAKQEDLEERLNRFDTK